MEGSSPSESQIASDTMLAHYRVLSPLGAGAMGTVYEAHDTALDRAVAVKVLKSDISQDEDIVRRFQREARAAARVNHANLTHIYFVGETAGRYYFAMELLPGRNLEDRILEDGPMELDDAIDVLTQAARGLAAAHEAGVIHRDVKPSNIMLQPSGAVKVTDFGLAKALSGDTDVTGAGRVMGTPRYMSPEQCRGQALDPRSDIYNLGLLAWFLLAGRHPFQGKTLGAMLDEQMNRPLPDLGELRPELPKQVQKTLQRLTAKEREKRPADMAAVIEILEDLRPQPLALAPLVARAAAILIDVLIYSLAVAMLTGGAGIGFALMGFGDSGAWVRSLLPAVNVGLWLFLQLGMERLAGGSLAKLLFNFRVVARDGSRPEVRALVYRFLLRYPGSLLLLVPPTVPYALPILITAWALNSLALLVGVLCYAICGKRTLSDLLTNTRVIYRSSKSETATS
jgi:tRNA A-37 threonylcarbamoyl transferase component Bud32/uncharacterized RDD family membrane protein YckC